MLPIVIDTNIFKHLKNPPGGKGDTHIHQLLASLATSHTLQVDKYGKILGEYEVILSAMIDNPDNQDEFEIYLLRYWLKIKEHRVLEKPIPHNLRDSIRKIIIEVSETIDCCFVETAALSDCDLITNDELHIYNRAKDLKKSLRKLGYKKTEILNSLDARDKFCSNVES
ncbi:hypothetical protein [Nostoc sp. WHI]|uniref:hypothetical protein n=1 Tax=Nostoc sp. WHI TaxID=2650611 RepID=UPI0018C5E82A|nr:hypothetical protein [Nostoc sp. WHI]MBG1268361.1 PIN domain-containing protein [Nostoc sp. WHI]